MCKNKSLLLIIGTKTILANPICLTNPENPECANIPFARDPLAKPKPLAKPFPKNVIGPDTPRLTAPLSKSRCPKCCERGCDLWGCHLCPEYGNRQAAKPKITQLGEPCGQTSEKHCGVCAIGLLCDAGLSPMPPKQCGKCIKRRG